MGPPLCTRDDSSAVWRCHWWPRGCPQAPGTKATIRRGWLPWLRERGSDGSECTRMSGDMGRRAVQVSQGCSWLALGVCVGGWFQRFDGGKGSEASFVSLCEIHFLPWKGVSSPLLGAFKPDDSNIGQSMQLDRGLDTRNRAWPSQCLSRMGSICVTDIIMVVYSLCSTPHFSTEQTLVVPYNRHVESVHPQICEHRGPQWLSCGEGQIALSLVGEAHPLVSKETLCQPWPLLPVPVW